MNNNVLWKRLYYGLFIIAIGLIGCFCNAGFETLLTGNGNTRIYGYGQLGNANNNNRYEINTNNIGDTFCISGTIITTACTNNNTSGKCQLRFGFGNGDVAIAGQTPVYAFPVNTGMVENGGNFFGCVKYYGIPTDSLYVGLVNSSTSYADYNINYEIMKLTPDNNGGGQQCDYTDYELKSNITENYCKNKFNNLIDENDCNCENEGENECTGGSENGTGEINWSSIFINNIQHNGAGLINITIPEEIERNYTNQNDEIDVDVIGYGYDQEKMQSMVNTQYYTPTPEDMNKLIGKIADFLPLMAIVLLVCYAWRLIKKIF